MWIMSVMFRKRNMRFLAVSREVRFSPNREQSDAAILAAVAACLERAGHSVDTVPENVLTDTDGYDGIFQMARSSAALDILDRADVPVTNTSQAVRNCGRIAQTRLLEGLIPESMVCHGSADGWNRWPCWIKRGDSHAVNENDVAFVHSLSQCSGDFVLQSHAPGFLVKFYGVRGTGIVDCYAAGVKDGKFGLERYNDSPEGRFIDMDMLTDTAVKASDRLGVDVYGGDAVVAEDGNMKIIDFNDWPSFRTCTVGAARAIAKLIMEK